MSGTASALILMVFAFWVAFVPAWRTLKEAHDAGVPLGLRGDEGTRVTKSNRDLYQELVGHLRATAGPS